MVPNQEHVTLREWRHNATTEESRNLPLYANTGEFTSIRENHGLCSHTPGSACLTKAQVSTA